MEIKPIPMTEATKERLVKELAAAREEVAAAGHRIGEAAKQGDLRENSGYELAREEQAAARAKVLMLRQSLLKPEILKPRQETDTVDIGNLVSLEFEDGSVLELTLLGTEDGATNQDWLSCDTPLGLAIRDKKLGDEVVLESGRVKILSIKPGNF